MLRLGSSLMRDFLGCRVVETECRWVLMYKVSWNHVCFQLVRNASVDPDVHVDLGHVHFTSRHSLSDALHLNIPTRDALSDALRLNVPIHGSFTGCFHC